MYIYYFVLVKGCVGISVRDDENERVREKAISLSSEKTIIRSSILVSL